MKCNIRLITSKKLMMSLKNAILMLKKDGTHLIIETYHIVEFAENKDGEMEYIGEVCVTPLPKRYS